LSGEYFLFFAGRLAEKLKAKLQRVQKIIKSAYRRQARKHHPDLGGSKIAFRQVHEAYKDLIKWAEEPSFSRRNGFPDKWFYDGFKNKWVQPTPVQKGQK